MMNLPYEVNTALEMLKNAGYEAYIVGGCVRDSLLGAVPKDHDITTSALPQQTEAVRTLRCGRPKNREEYRIKRRGDGSG